MFDKEDELIEMVTIPKRLYEDLLECDRKLSCLESMGVDNWCGYSDAMELYYNEEDE